MAEDGQSDFEGTKKSSASIRDASPPPSATVAPPEHDSEDTFHQLMSIFIDQPIGSMSISEFQMELSVQPVRAIADSKTCRPRQSRRRARSEERALHRRLAEPVRPSALPTTSVSVGGRGRTGALALDVDNAFAD